MRFVQELEQKTPCKNIISFIGNSIPSTKSRNNVVTLDAPGELDILCGKDQFEESPWEQGVQQHDRHDGHTLPRSVDETRKDEFNQRDCVGDEDTV